MSCINPNNPVFKALVKKIGNDMLARIEYSKLEESSNKEIRDKMEVINILGNLTPDQIKDWDKYSKGTITAEQLSDRLQLLKEQKGIFLDVLGQSKEPTLKQGYIRLYRAENETGVDNPMPDWMTGLPEIIAAQEAEGRWFYKTYKEASYHADTFGSDGISYIDIPTDTIEGFNARNNKFVGGYGKNGNEYFVSKELADSRKKLVLNNQIIDNKVSSNYLFEQIIKNPENEDLKKIAELLNKSNIKNRQVLLKAYDSVSPTHGQAIGFIEDKKIATNVAVTDFDYLSNLTTNEFDKEFFKNQSFQETLLHEELHRYTSYLLQVYNHYFEQTKNETDALKELKNYFENVLDKSNLEKEIEFIKEYNILYKIYKDNGGRFNNREFITYGLTNPQEIYKLKSIKVNKDSLLDRMIKALFKLFSTPTLYDALYNTFSNYYLNFDHTKYKEFTDTVKLKLTPLNENSFTQTKSPEQVALDIANSTNESNNTQNISIAKGQNLQEYTKNTESLSPNSKKVLDFVLKNFSKISNSTIIHNDQAVYDEMTKGTVYEKSGGVYAVDDETGEIHIYINPRYADSETFVHEVVHAFTEVILKNPQTQEEIKFVQTVNKLYEEFKNIKGSERLNGGYQFNDISEFLVYSLTNTEMQWFIKANEKAKTLLDKVINYIKSLFRLTDTQFDTIFKQFQNVVNTTDYSKIKERILEDNSTIKGQLPESELLSLKPIIDTFEKDIKELNIFNIRELQEEDRQRNNDPVNEKEREFLKNSKFSKGYVLNLGTPSSILRRIGMPKLPITVGSRWLLDHIIRNPEHNLKLLNFTQLVEAIHNPIAILQDKDYRGEDGRIDILTTIKSKNGIPVNVIIQFNKKFGELEVNSITTAFETDLYRFQKASEKNNVSYIDKERITNYLQGVLLPSKLQKVTDQKGMLIYPKTISDSSTKIEKFLYFINTFPDILTDNEKNKQVRISKGQEISVPNPNLTQKQQQDYERLMSDPQFLEDTKEVFEGNDELKNHSLQQYQDYVAKISSGIIRNPSSGEFNNSKVQDVVYHGSDNQFESFLEDNLNYFGTKKIAEGYGNVLYPALIEINKPYYEDGGNLSNQSYEDLYDKLDKSNSDGFISNSKILFIPKSEEQIHILGSKVDIKGFKNYTEQNSNNQNNTSQNQSILNSNNINELAKQISEINQSNNVEDTNKSEDLSELQLFFNNLTEQEKLIINSKTSEEFENNFALRKSMDSTLTEEEYITELEECRLGKIKTKPNIKAEKGLSTSFSKGGKWSIVKELKGATHAEGGIDLTIGKDGVRLRGNGNDFYAKNGLVIKAQKNNYV